MTATKKSQGRGRPRSFDIEKAITTAQALFHEHGYDGVGLAALTQALGISPPSFYAAFGSKAGLFDKVLERYDARGFPIDKILMAGRPPAEALTELLDVAARAYAADPRIAGCLVLESARACDTESARHARPYKEASCDRIRAFVAATHPQAAGRISDYITVTMSGLSANARQGWDETRLVEAAGMAASALPAALE